MVLRSMIAAVVLLIPVLASAQMPGPGERLPEITIYDAQGESFQLREVEGELSVIVFGCLT